MGKWISPQQLYDNPKLWLNIDHQFHTSLMKLMTKLFPDWSKRLEEIGCHCFECEGKEPIPCHDKDGKGLIVGYVERPEKLLNIRRVEARP